MQGQRLVGTGVAQIQPDADSATLTGIGGVTLLLQAPARLVHQAVHLSGECLQPSGGERRIDMALPATGLACLTHAIGRQHSRQGMQQHGTKPELLGQAAGVLAGSAAVGHQHATADVLAPVKGNPADRCCHPLDGQLQRRLGHLFGGAVQVDGQIVEQLPHHCRIRGLIGLRTEHRRELIGPQATQQQVGVGNGERTAGAVTGRAGTRSGRAGAHPQLRSMLFQHGAATGCDGLDRQPFGQQGQSGDRGLALQVLQDSRIGRGNTEHIRRCAAHVETQHRTIAESGGMGRRNRPHHAGSGSGQDRVLGEQDLRGLQRTTGRHHPQRRCGPESTLHLLQIGLKHRSHRPLHQCRLAPGHQSGFGTHVVGTDHRAEAKLTQQRGAGLLVDWVAVSVQQGHHRHIQPLASLIRQGLTQRSIQLQRLDFNATGIQPTRHLQHPLGQKGTG